MNIKKKGVIIIAISMILILLIITTIVLVMCFNTDMLKSKNSLFAQYFTNNLESTNNITKAISDNELNAILKESKYTSETKIKLQHTPNSTTSENTSSSINSFNVVMNGKIDKTNNYNYQDIKLLNNSEEKLKIQYIEDNNTFGVKFPELFQQYILVENSNLKDLFKKIGYEEFGNIIDNINIDDDIISYINFTDDEINKLKNKYSNLLEEQVSKQNISKKSNEIITINDQQINTKSYSLTLTKEQMNNLYLAILQMIKEDEIILNKLSSIDSAFTSYYSIFEGENKTDLKAEFVNDINSTIKKINETNIGNEQTNIIVYESNKNTVRTTIQYVDYEINFDILQSNGEQYVELSINNNDDSKIQTITLQNNNENINLKIVNNIDGDVTTKIIKQSAKIEGNKGNKNVVFVYEDNSNKIETTIEENIELVNEFDKANIGENNIKLNDLEEGILKGIVDKVQASLSEKANTIFTDQNKYDFNQILKVLGITKEEKKIESEGITETEKSRFNAKFEILQGENLDNERIINIIDVAKENIINMNVVSNTQLKIQLDKSNSNQEVVNNLKSFVENEDNARYNYNMSLEYDETGLAKYIVLDIIDE